MKDLSSTRITPGDAPWPRRLTERLGTTAPPQLSALGNLDLLALPKTALFCSARCPGNIILTAYDQAAKWRDADRCVIGVHQQFNSSRVSDFALAPVRVFRVFRGWQQLDGRQ